MHFLERDALENAKYIIFVLNFKQNENKHFNIQIVEKLRFLSPFGDDQKLRTNYCYL